MVLGKLTALDMTPLGWLGRKTSTQTKKKKKKKKKKKTSYRADTILWQTKFQGN